MPKIDETFWKRDKYNPICLTETEQYDIKELVNENRSFYDSIISAEKNDYTNTLMNELRSIFYSQIPRAFILNVRGRIGRLSGIFKTAMGLQIALSIDDDFSVEERVGFTPDDLLQKVKATKGRQKIFFLDEYINDLKVGALLRMRNVMENCRESQYNFICCGIPEQTITYTDYTLERVGESDDAVLPDKTVYYSVKKNVDWRSFYRGYFKWNIIPLSNAKWKSVWDTYSKMKREHQDNVINSQVSHIDYHSKAEWMLEKLKEVGEGLTLSDVKRYVFVNFPDYTRDDKNFIQQETEILYREWMREEKKRHRLEELDKEKEAEEKMEADEGGKKSKTAKRQAPETNPMEVLKRQIDD